MKQHWQVLKIDRTEVAELNVVEDPLIYTEAECKTLLSCIAEGNKPTGGLQFVTKCYGIIGKVSNPLHNNDCSSLIFVESWTNLILMSI